MPYSWLKWLGIPNHAHMTVNKNTDAKETNVCNILFVLMQIPVNVHSPVCHQT